MKNLELFTEISKIIDNKLDSKLDTLVAEIKELKATNEKLLLINKSLIDQNKQLRNSKCIVEEVVSEIIENMLDVVYVDEHCDAVAISEVSKTHYDCLLLSDSIYRHVGKSIPKTPGPARALYQKLDIRGVTILKVIIPGARCDRLWSEAVLISATHTFSEIICQRWR